ncbi:unnamed protein product, partial [Amoebophrya sp. A25]|eukprot:GSA25T00022685001.1
MVNNSETEILAPGAGPTALSSYRQDSKHVRGQQLSKVETVLGVKSNNFRADKDQQLQIKSRGKTSSSSFEAPDQEDDLLAVEEEASWFYPSDRQAAKKGKAMKKETKKKPASISSRKPKSAGASSSKAGGKLIIKGNVKKAREQTNIN